MELSFAQMVVLACGGMIYGISKTGIFGIATVLVPMMLYLFTPGQALGLAIPMLVMADVAAIILFRKSVCKRLVLLALPWAFTGIFLAWRFLAWAQALPDNAGDPLLRKVISGLIVFVLLSGLTVRVFKSRFEDPDRPPEIVHAPFTLLRIVLSGLIALVGGFVTMVANNSAPAWVVFLMLFQLQKFNFLGTAAWIVFTLNVTKIPFAVSLGYVNTNTLLINLYMVPFLIIGLTVGKFVANRLSQRFFDILTQTLALLGGIYLLLTN